MNLFLIKWILVKHIYLCYDEIKKETCERKILVMKLIIKNKVESVQKIKELKLNTFPEALFKKGEESKVLEFVEKYPAEYYAIRDKSSVGGVFKLKVKKENILDEIKEYELFTINVSSINYAENQIMEADIEIKRNGNIYITISKSVDENVRDNIESAYMSLKTDIFDNKTLSKIPDFDYIYSYLYENNLFDCLVEFSLFDKPVGINNERIIIWELRTHY